MHDVHKRLNNFQVNTGAGVDAAGRAVYSGPGVQYMGPGEFARTQQVHAKLAADSQEQDQADAKNAQDEESAWARGRQLFQEQLASREQARRERETDQQAEIARGANKAIQSLGGGLGGGSHSTNLYGSDGSRIGGSWLRKGLLG